ncbi:hypothetical protein BDP27DRAFT_593530 [Rhodocollybia butyracea]|uniref:Uncharacterized protein n=1 Tax=Rhodocollybia butyracea TaxID=206335 RepID=A0A9P5PY80_9AGAR|nr:hypothetical protein BDP27DRAFT_593530 [Rhodocollybia butyracea]
MIKEKFKPQFQLQHVKGLRMESILEYKTAPHERGEQGSAARARFALKIRDDKHLYFGWILPSIESGIIGSIYSISPSPNEHQKWKPYRWRRKHVAYGTEVKKFDKKFVEALNEVSVAEWEKRVKGYQDCYTKPYKPRTRKTSSMAVASEQSMIAESNRISAEPKGGSPTDSVSTSHSSESDGHSGYNGKQANMGYAGLTIPSQRILGLRPIPSAHLIARSQMGIRDTMFLTIITVLWPDFSPSPTLRIRHTMLALVSANLLGPWPQLLRNSVTV